MFSKFLDKQEGRILCLKYDSTGNFIASGSMDTVRVWDVTTGTFDILLNFGQTVAS